MKDYNCYRSKKKYLNKQNVIQTASREKEAMTQEDGLALHHQSLSPPSLQPAGRRQWHWWTIIDPAAFKAHYNYGFSITLKIRREEKKVETKSGSTFILMSARRVVYTPVSLPALLSSTGTRWCPQEHVSSWGKLIWRTRAWGCCQGHAIHSVLKNQKTFFESP